MKEKWVQTFTDYVNTFDMSDSGIALKYHHSLRVMDIAEQIAIYEKFNEKDTNLSILIGLLHDYARFYQWTKFKTFSGINTIDHGDYATTLLFKQNHIAKYNIDSKYYDEIYDAIKYHNKMSINDNLSIHNNKLCKMIRDADKLDIFHIYVTDKSLFTEDDKEISKKVKESFYKKQQVSYLDVLSKNDKIVLDFALVFDLNFDFSFKYLKEHKLIEKMYETLENKEMFKEYYDYIINYINERID